MFKDWKIKELDESNDGLSELMRKCPDLYEGELDESKEGLDEFKRKVSIMS